MARTFRFFVTPEDFGSGVPALDSDEAHHAIRVARVRPGERVEIFDGAGGVAICEVRNVGRRDVSLEVLSREQQPPPEHRLTLCVAFPNRERAMERIIESCVPLGVTDFVVFGSDHSDRKPGASPKWERWARESCKQSYRSWMPEFTVAQDLDQALESCRDALVLILTPDAGETQLPAAIERAPACACVIGPEGGMSPREVDLAVKNGAIPIGLGPYVLRTELACSTIAALVTHTWRSASANE